MLAEDFAPGGGSSSKSYKNSFDSVANDAKSTNKLKSTLKPARKISSNIALEANGPSLVISDSNDVVSPEVSRLDDQIPATPSSGIMNDETFSQSAPASPSATDANASCGIITLNVRIPGKGSSKQDRCHQ